MYNRGVLFGAFDPLHFGHIRLFRRARKRCKKIYACTKTDDVIRAEKNREPYTTVEERVRDLEGIKYLNGVVVVSKEKDRKYWINELKAEVIFVGDDWKGKDWIGTKLGLPVIFLPYTKEICSTSIRNNPKSISSS